MVRAAFPSRAAPAFALFLALLGVGAFGCACPQTATSPSSPTSPTTTTTTTTPARAGVPPRLPLETGIVVLKTESGEQRFRVEVAAKDHERQRGLMYREHLDDDEGMLFLFERMQPLSFWMKNTWIPLDMFFIDEDFVVVGIVENAEPLTTSSRRVAKPSRYVLELAGGAAQKLGLKAGDTARFEGVPLELIQKASP